jgi:hypothetical protein
MIDLTPHSSSFKVLARLDLAAAARFALMARVLKAAFLDPA